MNIVIKCFSSISNKYNWQMFHQALVQSLKCLFMLPLYKE